MDGRRRRPTRCPDRQTPGQYVTQLPDDLDHPTLQGSYCASPSLRAAVAPEPYVSFTARSRLLCYHIIPIKVRHKLWCLLPGANHFQHLWVFFFLFVFEVAATEPTIALCFVKWWIQGLDVEIRSSVHPFLIPALGLRGLLEPLTAVIKAKAGRHPGLPWWAVPHKV